MFLVYCHAVIGAENEIIGTAYIVGDIPQNVPLYIEIKLLNVSVADAVATEVGKQVMGNISSNAINFSISYDPKEIRRTDTYILEARLLSRSYSGTLFRTTQAYPVDFDRKEKEHFIQLLDIRN